MSLHTSKHLSEIKTEFERAMFLVLYNSRKQRLHRGLAAVMLGIKHALRGLLFSWPLYLLTLAAYRVPGPSALIFLLLLLPGVLVSWAILSRGVKEDYENRVEGYLMRTGHIGQMLFKKKT